MLLKKKKPSLILGKIVSEILLTTKYSMRQLQMRQYMHHNKPVPADDPHDDWSKDIDKLNT